MTGDLILTAHFQEIPIRIVQREKDRMIPLVDIARALDYDRGSLTHMLKKHEALFEGMKGVVLMTTPGGMQKSICLTRDGVIGLLMKMDYQRAKSPDLAERLIKFQKWAITTLGKVIDGAPVAPQHEAHPFQSNPEASAMLEEHLRMAKALTEYAGVKPGIAAAVAIAVVQDRTGVDLTWCKNLLPAASDPPGYLIPSEIGMQIGISAQRVNETLQDLGYQVKSREGWKLTGPGRFYGEEYPFSRNGHSGYQIRWKPEVIRKIGDRIRGLQELQQQPAITGYLS
jgi:prophage antirepressor-like protein